MRTPPGPIPKTLPPISQVVKAIHETIHRPITRLADASIWSLIGDKSWECWLTGSTVWLQAVYGEKPDLNGDFDIIFADPLSCRLFEEKVLSQLNSRIGNPQPRKLGLFELISRMGEPYSTGRYEVNTNKMGGSRIVHPDGRGVMDLWSLGDESIAECVSAFPGGDHVKCAYKISAKAEVSNLTRVVRIPDRKHSSYPGK